MSTFKQVHNKFWQNDFVLGLTAEERYFYIYLITNSMTNQCGIFKFNRRLAELETGYNAEQIEKYLVRFQDYGKVVISSTTTEVMLVNWFKHNFKSNKKEIALINKELKDIKDKDLFKKLHDFCRNRQYPVAEIFNGIILPGVEISKEDIQVSASSEAAVEIQEEAKVIAQQKEETIGVSSTSEPIQLAEDKPKTDSIVFSNFLNCSSEVVENEADEEGEIEEGGVLEEYEEEDSEDLEGGITIAAWDFTEGCTTISFGESLSAASG